MPYLTPKRKDTINTPEMPGDLNFMVTELLMAYMRNNGVSYQTCNDIVGALENAKDEFQRRIQHPYEDMKRMQNGDVYDMDWVWGEGVK